MAKRDWVPFERLVWGGEDRANVGREPDADREAVAILMALGGFQCGTCRQSLTEAKGYVCCGTAHCPFCGQPMTTASYNSLSSQGCCAHLLHRNTDDYWSFDQVSRRGKQSEAERERWNKLLQPTPPARRLPTQRGPGYPHWTDAQKAEAYPDEFTAHLPLIFTPSLRIYSSKRLHPVMLPYLRPEIKTQVRDMHGHRHDYYFLANTDAAMEEAAHFLTQLEAGTKKLRAMLPDSIIRVIKD